MRSIIRILKAWSSDVLIMILTGQGLCFLFFPNLAQKYPSYFLFQFVPNWMLAIGYLSVAMLGLMAILQDSVKLWRLYSLSACAAFGGNTAAFIVAFFVSGGTPTAATIHGALAWKAFNEYCRPYLRLLMARGLANVPDRG